MTGLTNSAESDSLAALEERVRQAAALVARLKKERDAALADQQAAERRAALLGQELEALRAERAQVRSRVEKLLEQIDALAAG